MPRSPLTNPLGGPYRPGCSSKGGVVKLPAESNSSWHHLSFAAYVYASLTAWSESGILGAEDGAGLATLGADLRLVMDVLLKEARDTQDAVIFKRPVAQAKQNAAFGVLRRTVKEALQTAITKLGGGSEDHPQVRVFLPRLLGGIVGARLADRADEASRAAARLKSVASFEGRDALATRIETKAAADALEAAETAWAGLQNERSEEVVAKGKLRLALESTYGALGARFPGQRDFVESFFLRGTRASEDDDGGAVEPAPTA
jgi:hypothetical protein